MTETDDRPNNFNALRLFCAFAILVSHYFPLRDGVDTYEPFMRLSGFCNIGKIVTYMTFVISGLLITQAYLRNPNLARYFRHRALRILPALWAAVAFCVVAIGLPLTKLPLKSFLHQGETLKFIANIALYPNHYDLPGVFTQFPLADFRTAVNGSLWVIPPLVLMYLMIAALGAMNLLRRPAVPLAIALLSLAAWEFYQVHGIDGHSRLFKYKVWIDFIPHLSFFFFTGAAVASWQGRLLLSFGLFLLTLALAAVCLRTPVGYLVLSLCIPYLTLYLGLMRAPILRPFNRAGAIAFGVYLYGWPAQQLIMRVWCPNAAELTQVILSCLLAGALGTFSWWLIERPALTLAREKNAGTPGLSHTRS